MSSRAQTVQQIPLNGRHFADLGLLVPGSVAPSQTGFSTTPIRGVGALAINTAGNREEAVGFLVNGVTTNNLTFGSLMFEPPLASIQEFKVDNSAFSAEYGHVSGAIVNIVTRSGTDGLHGEAFEFFRNDALDARNFFEFTSPEPHPLRAEPVRRIAGRPVDPRTELLLRRLRGAEAAAGRRHEQPRAQRRAARGGSRSGRPTADRADPAREFLRRATARRGSSVRRRPSSTWIAGRSTFGTTPATAIRLHGVLRTVSGSARSSRLSQGNINSRVRPRSPAAAQPPDPRRNAHLRRRAAERSAVRPQRPRRRHASRRRRSIQRTSASRTGSTRPIGLPQMIVAGGLNFGGPGILPQGRTRHVICRRPTRSAARAAGTR